MVKQKLLDQVRDAVRVRHLSYRTEQAYVDCELGADQASILIRKSIPPRGVFETEAPVFEVKITAARSWRLSRALESSAVSPSPLPPTIFLKTLSWP